MEGRLCRWALALQEFDFTIKYSKGINNQNADALSRLVSDRSNHFNAAVQVVAPIISNQELQSAQTADPVISKVISTLLEGAEPQALVVQDYFTKWLSVFPLKNQTASAVAQQLIQLFYQMGRPRIVHTDQGRNFESDLFKHGRTYHPEGDGLVERSNRTILQILRSLADKDSQWDQLLPAAVLAYSTSQHVTTGFTPYELMFGRQPLLVDGPFHILGQQGYDPPSYHDQLLARMQRTYHSARSHMQKAAERQRRAYDAHNTAKPVYQAGDSVWLYRITMGIEKSSTPMTFEKSSRVRILESCLKSVTCQKLTAWSHCRIRCLQQPITHDATLKEGLPGGTILLSGSVTTCPSQLEDELNIGKGGCSIANQARPIS
ncbi:hypothetical protein M514_08589 [Trichuris suis]|uniref:Integrase catalytic domain-containing protein n=1 Tax=Trichuris suis TaxID=68888 RepID=A0A085N1V9_9BILA|nr:hypothetical protein M513_08589 [Trichuris suis]KFD63455.1 hypothetical protein M514_08589 [Trichuris suis]